GGIGRPTPEGAHRDGVDFVAILMVGRENIRGGESRVFEAHGPKGLRFTVMEPWSALLIDDARVIHETTPIQPAQGAPGWRDALALTDRADGFLSRAPGDGTVWTSCRGSTPAAACARAPNAAWPTCGAPAARPR